MRDRRFGLLERLVFALVKCERLVAQIDDDVWLRADLRQVA